MDPHIFADPDPGSQNLADPTDPDPDPKHCIFLIKEVPQLTKTEIKIHIVFLIQATRFM